LATSAICDPQHISLLSSVAINLPPHLTNALLRLTLPHFGGSVRMRPMSGLTF